MIIPCRPALSLVLAIAALLAAGCVSSTKPLSDAKTSQPDLRLLGTWEYQEEDSPEKMTIVISKKKDSPNVLEIVGDDGEKKETMELLLTKVGSDYLASVEEKDDNGKTKYVIGKYELLEDGNVKLSGLDVDFFAAAVGNKELKGTVMAKLFKDVELDDTPENLRKFIEKHGAKCYGKADTQLTVKRVKKDGVGEK